MSNPRLQKSTSPVSFIVQVLHRVYQFINAPKPAFLVPLSWILTLQIFTISLIWYISTLPIRIGMDLYERHIRAIFPKLPSIRALLLSARTAALAFIQRLAPDLDPTSFTHPPQNGQSANGPAGTLPTLDVDLNALAGNT